MAPAIDSSLIVSSPEIKNGRPRLAGTGITVMRIAGWHNQGMAPEDIAANWGYISIAQVQAALAYYQAHREAIDSDIAAEHATYAALAAAAKSVASKA